MALFSANDVIELTSDYSDKCLVLRPQPSSFTQSSTRYCDICGIDAEELIYLSISPHFKLSRKGKTTHSAMKERGTESGWRDSHLNFQVWKVLGVVRLSEG